MKRADRDTRACVNPECHLFRRPGAATLTVRQVSGHDRLRLLRCRTCGEECSERRGTAWFHTKLPEATAEEVINHWGEGWSVRATARLVTVAKETVARLLRGAGRHAEWGHEQHGHGITPKALECDEHWSVVKKSRSAAQPTRRRGLALCGTPPRWPQTASGWGVWGEASAPQSRPRPASQTPGAVCVQGLCQRVFLLPRRALRPPAWRRVGVGTPPPVSVGKAGRLTPFSVGPKEWRLAKCTNRRKGIGASESTDALSLAKPA